MPIAEKPWRPAFKDRGLGHGDFGILDADDFLIAEIVERPEICAKETMHHIVDACNHHDEMISALEEALRRLTMISKFLKGGASNAEIQAAYDTAYPGTLQEILKRVQPNPPHNHCEICGFHTHEAKDCPYKE